MMNTLEAILYVLVFIDACGANVVAWTGLANSYARKFSIFSRYFPITRGWAALYLLLMIWLGVALWRLDILAS